MNKGLLTRTWNDFRFQWRTLLFFQLLVHAWALALCGPLITWVGRRLVLASGEAVISNYDIAAFLLSPLGAFSLLIVAAIGGGALLAELAGQSWISGHAISRRAVTLRSTIAAVLFRVPVLIVLSAWIFLRLVLLAVPFVAGAALVWHTFLHAHDINYYLSARPPEWHRALMWALLLAAGYVGVAVWQLGRWLYAVPILLYEGLLPRRALKQSARRTRGRVAHILAPLLLWWFLLAGAAIVVARATQRLEAGMLVWADIDFSRVLPLIAVFFVVGFVGAFLYSALLIAGQQFLVTRMYVEQLDTQTWQVPAALEIDKGVSRRIGGAVLIATSMLVAFALGATYFLGSRYSQESAVAITAHRGNSSVAPENSLSAFRAAIEAHANYSELDVQRTRDGQVVVLHDGDLMRMAGDPRKIGDLTMTELAGIDIGISYGPAFRGEHVPSLEEVIDLVRGRMKLNVELKYNVPDPQLASATVDILRRKDFLDQVVITSLDAEALKQVKAIEPRLRTGLIVTAAVGDVVRADADFLSLNSARATASVIRRAHAAGKQIHVWTVNRAEVMLRMIERRVDNIITNYPAVAARVVQERAALSPTELLAVRLRVLFGDPPPELTDPSAVTTL